MQSAPARDKTCQPVLQVTSGRWPSAVRGAVRCGVVKAGGATGPADSSDPEFPRVRPPETDMQLAKPLLAALLATAASLSFAQTPGTAPSSSQATQVSSAAAAVPATAKPSVAKATRHAKHAKHARPAKHARHASHTPHARHTHHAAVKA
jgi:hypothetical protein